MGAVAHNATVFMLGLCADTGRTFEKRNIWTMKWSNNKEYCFQQELLVFESIKIWEEYNCEYTRVSLTTEYTLGKSNNESKKYVYVKTKARFPLTILSPPPSPPPPPR